MAKTAVKKTVAKTVTKRKTSAGGAIHKAKKIETEIAKLERERKEAKGKDLKEIYALEINRQHKRLNDLKRSLK